MVKDVKTTKDKRHEWFRYSPGESRIVTFAVPATTREAAACSVHALATLLQSASPASFGATCRTTASTSSEHAHTAQHMTTTTFHSHGKCLAMKNDQRGATRSRRSVGKS